MAEARSSLVDALLAAPVGACLLAALEGRERADVPWHELPPDVDADAVARAADRLPSSTLGEVLALAVDHAERSAGAWMPEAPEVVASAYRGAEARRPIAEALVATHAAALERPIDLARQEWWATHDPRREASWAQRCFVDLTSGYDAGEFPHRGLWTTGVPPREAHLAMLGIWELHPEPVSRWHLPVAGSPRVWELHRPEDWLRLVEAFGRDADPHGSWSLPGPNQGAHHVAVVVAASAHRAARTEVTRHRVPDWVAVAEHVDAVHLSWAGFLTAEGFVSDLRAGGVAMLRFWFAERTCWLRDCFGEPEPMPGPEVSWPRGLEAEEPPLEWTIDATRDAVRRGHDRELLRQLLGR